MRLQQLRPANLLLGLYRLATTEEQRRKFGAGTRAFCADGGRIARAIFDNCVFVVAALWTLEGWDPLETGMWFSQTVSTVGYGNVSLEHPASWFIVVWFLLSMIPLFALATAHALGVAIPALHLFTDAEQRHVIARVDEVKADVDWVVAAATRIADGVGVDLPAHDPAAPHDAQER
jgi:Ion channel